MYLKRFFLRKVLFALPVLQTHAIPIEYREKDGISGWMQLVDASHIIVLSRSTVSRNASPFATR